MEISAELALEYLKQGVEIMVIPYDDDYENFTGITIEDFVGDDDEDILEYLKEKDKIELWD